MRPNFLVIGAGKCGTTSVCAALAQHPDVFICEPKEPNFLSYDEIHALGWQWYESLFAGAEGTRCRGEGSVSYTSLSCEMQVISRIKRNLPDIRLIYVVRHPFARIASAFREMHTNQQKVFLPFSLRKSLDIAYDELIGESKYYERLSKYRDAFSEEQIHVMFLEDLQSNPDAELRRVFSFLRLKTDPDKVYRMDHLNAREVKLKDTRLMRAVRRSPKLVAWGRKISLHSSVRRLLRRPFVKECELDPLSKEYTIAELEQDARLFLAEAGKPPDFWVFD